MLVACAFQGTVVVSGTDGRERFRLHAQPLR
jgi:hypothetical protein